MNARMYIMYMYMNDFKQSQYLIYIKFSGLPTSVILDMYVRPFPISIPCHVRLIDHVCICIESRQVEPIYVNTGAAVIGKMKSVSTGLD